MANPDDSSMLNPSHGVAPNPNPGLPCIKYLYIENLTMANILDKVSFTQYEISLCLIRQYDRSDQ
jgi:hypothetical protein